MKTTSAAPWKRSKAFALIKQRIPHVRTVLGISNVSFGLPPGAREVVNSVFLYYCTKAGLDLAIVNAERIERFASIPENERKLAEASAFQHAARGNSGRPPARRAAARARRTIGARNRANKKPPSTNFTSRRSPSTFAAPAARRRSQGRRSAARSAPGELHPRRHPRTA